MTKNNEERHRMVNRIRLIWRNFILTEAFPHHFYNIDTDPNQTEHQSISSVGNLSEVAKIVQAALLKRKMEQMTTVKPTNYSDEEPSDDLFPGDQFWQF